jgi:hypothetical protein
MVSSKLLLLSGGLTSAAVLDLRRATTASGLATASATEPWYYQTTPELFAGPTPTGLIAPFLAQTNPAPWGAEASFVPNAPLETNLPIQGNSNNQSIFQLHGQLSSYFPNPVGFGPNEYPLPPGANISTVHVLHRHGARYPTGTSSVANFGSKIQNITANGTAKWTGDLSFLNSWRYNLGAEILVARGRQELFDAGVLFYYNYGMRTPRATWTTLMTYRRALQHIHQDRRENDNPRPNAEIGRVLHGWVLRSRMDSECQPGAHH